ncbi:polysaccharide biosynthesis tyrosine autokinase [Acetobacter sp. DsW_063]|uniref:GumC family protein n=1 Tax=Acetobacter sp. DsW_063 TaxID=1514894 RepID=UPI000A36B555|nr:polysaccharide biosynthesis tyrosine autokinase [Acetobacter sp. DsW_063]
MGFERELDHPFDNGAAYHRQPVDGYAVMWRYVGVMSRHRALFASVFAVAFLGGTGVVFSLKRSFVSTATVVVTAPVDDPFSQTAQGGKTLEDDELATQAELIQSRDVAELVLKQIPASEGGHKGGLRAALCSHGLKFACPAPAPSEQQGQLEHDARIDGLLATITVEPQPHSRVIALSAKADTADAAASIANAFISSYQQVSLTQQRGDLARDAEWLDERTSALRRRWVEAEKAASDFNAQHGLTNLDGDSPLVGHEIATMAASLNQAQARYAAAQARMEVLNEVKANGDPRSIIALGDQPLLVASANALMQAEAARAQKIGSFGPNHPDVVGLTGQVAAAKASLAAETRQALGSVNAELVASRAEVAQLTRSLDALRGSYTGQGAAQAEYRTLRQDADSAKSVYEAFLDRAKEFADRAALLRPPVAFVSHAAVPAAPTFPNRKKLELGVIVLGLISASTAVALRAMLSSGFTDIEELRRFGGLRLLAVLPKTRGLARASGKLSVGQSYSPIGDAARGLLTQLSLMRASGDADDRIVAVTSPTSGDGKSTLVSWLAATVQAGGQDVLVIGDAAGRSTVGHGLWDVASGRATADEAIERDATTGVDVLWGGDLSAFDPSGVDKLRAVLRGLSSRYRMIVIDAPSLMVNPDGLVLASIADQALFVCRWNDTSRRDAALCIERLRHYGVRVSGLVLNAAEGRAAGVSPDGQAPRASVGLLQHFR